MIARNGHFTVKGVNMNVIFTHRKKQAEQAVAALAFLAGTSEQKVATIEALAELQDLISIHIETLKIEIRNENEHGT